MPDTKISALTTTTAAAGDLLPIVDVSDTAMAASGSTRKLALSATGAALLNAADAAAARSALGLANLEAQRRIWSSIPAMQSFTTTSLLTYPMTFTTLPSGGVLATSSLEFVPSAAQMAAITSGADFTAVIGLTVRTYRANEVIFFARGSGGGLGGTLYGNGVAAQVHTLTTAPAIITSVFAEELIRANEPTLIRIRRVSNTIFVEFSQDGHVWASSYSESISSRMSDVTSLGLFFQGTGYGTYIWAFEVT